MKLILFICIILSCIIFNGCDEDEPQIEIPDYNQEQNKDTLNFDKLTLTWFDEFDGTNVNLNKWNYRAEGSLRHYATVSKNTISLDGIGNLVMKVTKDSEGNYYVGQLGTGGIFETKYGYFECSAKMNLQVGPHVAFWLQSPTVGNVGDPSANGTEIDIFEYHRKEPDIVHHNLHWNGYGTDHETTGKKINYPEIKTGFHTFGLLWTSKEYVFYVDGQETWRTNTAVSNRSEYLILSTELTGFGGDPELCSYPDSVIFDYVRVYKSVD